MLDFKKIIEAYKTFSLNELAMNEKHKKIVEETFEQCSFTLCGTDKSKGAVLNIPFFNYSFSPSFYFKIGVFEDEQKIYLTDFGQVSSYWREEFNDDICDYDREKKRIQEKYGLYREYGDHGSFLKNLKLNISYESLAKEIFTFYQVLFILIHIDEFKIKTKIYVARHGETVWNQKGIIQGRKNNRLSENGKRQVEQTEKLLNGKKIDLIICSPLTRTVQTANILNKNLKAKMIKDDDIIEIDEGNFSGRKYCDLSEEENNRNLKKHKAYGVESFKSVYDRAKNFLRKINEKYEDKKTIMIVTHNFIASMIEDIIKLKQFSDIVIPDDIELFKNAELKEFELPRL